MKPFNHHSVYPCKAGGDMVFRFNNYYVEVVKDPVGLYNLKIVKVTGPAKFDRELIVKSKVQGIDSMNEYIVRYIPGSQLGAY